MRTPIVATFIIVAAIAAVAGIRHQDPREILAVASVFSGSGSQINRSLPWPPKVGDPYPDLELTDVTGRTVRLSDYTGRTLIIEAIGMPCAACQAFSGGHEVGGLDGIQPQPGLRSFKKYFRERTGLNLADRRIRLIQIIFYGPNSRSAPTLAEARRWSDHFASVLPSDSVILFADSSLISRQTRSMIPGFQLVDRDFILRCDAGNPPRQDVYRELLPMVGRVVNR